MSVDATKIGQVAAELMELLDSGGEDVELGEVMVLAEIRGSNSEGDWTAIQFRCSDPRGWVQRGLLHAALEDEREVDEDEDE